MNKTGDNKPNLSYIVYAKLEGLNSSNQSASLLNPNETTMLSKDIPSKQLNVTACNGSTVLFYVSAKLEEVGEGSASSSIEFDVCDAEDKCRTGEYNWLVTIRGVDNFFTWGGGC